MEDKLRHQASYHTSLRVSTQHFTFSFIICTISSPTVRGTHVVRAFNCLTQTTTARAECSPPQTPQVSLHTVMDVHCWWKKTVTRGLKTLQREITWRSWNWVIVFWQNYQGHIHKTTLFWDGGKSENRNRKYLQLWSGGCAFCSCFAGIYSLQQMRL